MFSDGCLAEAQEEILRICEAAHVPVFWATQVLETLAKEGIPSRAEITDAGSCRVRHAQKGDPRSLRHAGSR